MTAVGIRTLVDVGANRGQFALIPRLYFPHARIVSFEPLGEAAATFRRVFAGGRRTTLHQIAVGSRTAEGIIRVLRADDSSSLLPMTTLQNELFPGTGEREVRVVQVKELGEVLGADDIEKPALLKLDVQGYEKEALKGCQSLLSEFAHVYLECSFVELYAGQSLAHEIIGFLVGKGFVLSGIYNMTYSTRGFAIQGDFMFSKKVPQ